jgi:hypothetical protein
MSNLLNNHIVYLAGSIEHSVDNGIGWREEIKQKSKNIGLNLAFLDPTHKPANMVSECNKEKLFWMKLRDEGHYDELTNFVKSTRRIDLRMVDLSSFLIAYIDPDVPSVGTTDEIIIAERQKKPIIAIIKGGKKRANLWHFAIMKHKEMFESIDECLNYLKLINSGKISPDDRWIFLHNYLFKSIDIVELLKESNN